MEKIFEGDILSKRERVQRTLDLLPVDRVAIHEQLSYNPGVIAHYCGRNISGFDYTVQDVGLVARKTVDMVFPLFSPIGEGTVTTDEGFVYKNDNWTKWLARRPFDDEHGAAEWLKKRTKEYASLLRGFSAGAERKKYHDYMRGMQSLAGECVLFDYSITTNFCDVFDKMGLEIFTFFYYDYPEIMKDFMEASTEYAVKKVLAAADNGLSPVVLIAEDFCTKQGPIFSPEILNATHYPYVKALASAWREKGYKVIYHTDGNFKKVIPDLTACGVDGFYCLERSCGMNIEELKAQYPKLVWMGGVDGVDVMEFGTPDDVKNEVRRIILKTDALRSGGIFIDTSSEINPTIPVENFVAMIQGAGEIRNSDFSRYSR